MLSLADSEKSRWREADATNNSPAPVPTVTIPYVKDSSDIIARILQPYNNLLAHKPTTTLRQQPAERSLQDQMLWLPGLLHLWDWQKS